MTERFEQWVILELMGHRRLAGHLSEQEIAGVSFLRLDVTVAGKEVTQFYAPAAVYAITPTTAEIARAVAADNVPEPVHPWELRRLEAPLREPDGIAPWERDDDVDDPVGEERFREEAEA